MTLSAYELAVRLDQVMRRVEAELHQRVPAVDTDRIGPLGCLTISRLADIEPAPVQRLVEQMGRDPSQMTRMLRTLEEKALVIRERSAEDGRVTIMTLSPKGHALVRTLREIISDIVEGVMHPLTQDERETLYALLDRMDDGVQRRPPRPAC